MAITKRVRNKTTGRNYKREYASYQGKPKVIAKRFYREAALRSMHKRGLVKKGSVMDVHHKDGNPMNNNKKNLRAISKFKNRSFARNKNGGKK